MLTVTGVNFIERNELKCNFDGKKEIDIEFISPTSVRCVVPDNSPGSSVSFYLSFKGNG